MLPLCHPSSINHTCYVFDAALAGPILWCALLLSVLLMLEHHHMTASHPMHMQYVCTMTEVVHMLI